MLLDEAQQRGDLELGHDQHGGAGAEGAEEDGVEGEDVEEGEHAEDDVVGGKVQVGVFAVDLLRHAGDEAPVGEDDPFWEPRGSRREGKRHRVVGVDGDLGKVLLAAGEEGGEGDATLGGLIDGDHLQVLSDRREHLVAELVDELGLCDDELRAGGLELLEDLRRRAEGIGGSGHGAEHGGGEEGEGELGAVLQEEHDGVPLPDAEGGQSGGSPARLELGLREGEGLTGGAGDETRAVGILGGLLEAVTMEGKVVRDGDIGEPRPEDRRLRRRHRRRRHLGGIAGSDLGLGLEGRNGQHLLRPIPSDVTIPLFPSEAESPHGEKGRRGSDTETEKKRDIINTWKAMR